MRFGVLWAALLLPALFGGPAWMAVLFAPVAAVAARQACRSRREATRPPIDGIATAGAALLVAGAVFGFVGLIAAAALTAVAAVALGRAVEARHRTGKVHASRSVAWTLGLAAVPGLAGAGPVLLRSISGHGAVPALALCTYALVYDASSFLMAAGSPRRWEGPIAGVASIGAVTLAVAAILVPPFRGASPWALGAAAALLTPLGPIAATAILGDSRTPLSALRRLDSLIVLGPVWAVLALWLVG